MLLSGFVTNWVKEIPYHLKTQGMCSKALPKKGFYCPKKLIELWDIDIDNIVI